MTGRKRLGIIIGLIFLGLVCIRLLHLNQDPPLYFPNGWRAYEPFTDEAAKAYQARSRVLFGQWNTSAKDEYRFWKVLSPVWCYPLFVWFKALGVSYGSLRLFSLFWFVAGLGLIFLLFRNHPPEHAGLYAAWFYALNFNLYIFSRLGLMETMLNTFLLLTFCLVARSAERKWLFPLGLLAFLAAYFVKQNALLLFPILVVGYFLTFGSPFKKSFWKDPANYASLALAAFMLGLLVHLWHDPTYRLYTVMNFRHGYGLPPDRSRSWFVIRLDFIRNSFFYHFSPRGWWQTYFALDPIVGSLGLLDIILIALAWAKRRERPAAEILALTWLIGFRVLLSFSSARVERFWLPQIPAMIVLAGAGLGRIHAWLKKDFARPVGAAVVALILAASLAYNFHYWLKWFSHPRYEMVTAGKKLEQMLPDRPAVVIGKWAGPLLLGSRHQFYYVKNIFNRSPEQLQSFKIAYLLLGDVPLLVRDQSELAQDPYLQSFQAAFPRAFDQKALIGKFDFYNGDLSLYQVQPGP